MKVILVKNVPNLGKVGDVKEVAEGYAQNFLLPNKLVRLASAAAIKEVSSFAQSKVKKKTKQVRQFVDIAKKVNNLKIIVQAKADEKKTLFGSINAKVIAQELKNRGYAVEEKFIKLAEPIKVLGFYNVDIVFSSELKAKIGLTVTREE